MKSRHLRMGIGFLPLFEANGVQAAQMVIPPGGREGGPDNRHRGADQWLFVASGRGMAIVEGARRALRPGSLLLIERGERHEIRATGDGRRALEDGELLFTARLYRRGRRASGGPILMQTRG